MKEVLLLILFNMVVVLLVVFIATRVVLLAIKNKRVKKLKKYIVNPK